MYNHLSNKQKEILRYDKGCVVVKACPGSGKTYSVSARVSRLLNTHDFKRKGICAISFTNVACDEIIDKLSNDFNCSVPLSYPHFIGTLDSFINNYIFMPFGHLYMKCRQRPELVGEPFSTWSINRFERDSHQYFDKTTFDINDRLIPLAPYQAFHFNWKYYNQKGQVNGHIQNIIKSKYQLFNKGYANQSDANYIALKILQKFSLIAENVANQFEFMIIDEAQDTNDIQMSIIDILGGAGANNIMMIGDRDQSIFEWNNARPELFDKKYNEWDKIELNENRRSSSVICRFIKPLSSFSSINAINGEVADFNFTPAIYGYEIERRNRKTKQPEVDFQESKESFDRIVTLFCATCEENNIKIIKDNVAVLYRGQSKSKFLGVQRDKFDFDFSPWISNHYHVKDIAKGKHLYDNGFTKDGYRLMEKGLLESIKKPHKKDFYCTSKHIQSLIDLHGIKKHRREIFKFINLLPSTRNITLNEWISASNQELNTFNINLSIKTDNGNLLLEELFGNNIKNGDRHPFFFGTVHSAKGKTFEAVLLFIGKKSGRKNYANLLKENIDNLDSANQEELRIVYVGMSRPRKILFIAVPNEDVPIWKQKFL